MAYVQLNMPGSDLERRAHRLLAQLEHADLGEAEPEGEEGGVGAGLRGAPPWQSRRVRRAGWALDSGAAPWQSRRVRRAG